MEPKRSPKETSEVSSDDGEAFGLSEYNNMKILLIDAGGTICCVKDPITGKLEPKG
eukprot:gene33958-41884_t